MDSTLCNPEDGQAPLKPARGCTRLDVMQRPRREPAPARRSMPRTGERVLQLDVAASRIGLSPDAFDALARWENEGGSPRARRPPAAGQASAGRQ
jgi:hypothetical protein